MDLSLYYAALEHRVRRDPDVVLPSASWKTGKAKRRFNKASAETSNT